MGAAASQQYSRNPCSPNFCPTFSQAFFGWPLDCQITNRYRPQALTRLAISRHSLQSVGLDAAAFCVVLRAEDAVPPCLENITLGFYVGCYLRNQEFWASLKAKCRRPGRHHSNVKPANSQRYFCRIQYNTKEAVVRGFSVSTYVPWK